MVKLPPRDNPTAAAIFARHERDAEDWRRLHLGASIIGEECRRFLWLSFRWASKPQFGGRMLRLFERGDREEAWIVEELRAIGMTVEDKDKSKPIDPETGEHPQYRQEWIGGHFGGGCDGKVLGVIEAPKTWHVLEVKTSNKKRFEELRKNGVKKSNPKHFAQMQVYMHGFGLSRALYVCVCKDNDEIYTERVSYDKAAAIGYLNLAMLVVTSPEPLTRISEDPTWFKCKWCDQRPVCHLGAYDKLERNCRTCAAATPMVEGGWRCEYHGRELEPEEQRRGCDHHVFVPALLPAWEAVDADDAERFVVYKKPDGSRVVDFGGELLPQ